MVGKSCRNQHLSSIIYEGPQSNCVYCVLVAKRWWRVREVVQEKGNPQFVSLRWRGRSHVSLCKETNNRSQV